MKNRLISKIIGWDYTLFTAIVFMGIMGILFTYPVQEGDFFWHVRTGQWIWEHKSIPSADHFSHVNWFINQTEHIIGRTQFILKQYWLGQLALFGVWNAFGEAGMVMLRTVIYTGILIFIYWWVRRDKDGIMPLATIFVVGNVLVNFPNERPQIFAFLLMVFMLYLLEQLCRRDRAPITTNAALLLLVMLAWSNCHGSFILGFIVIALYAAGHLLTYLLRGGILNRRLLAVLTGAALITFVNPNGFDAFKSVLDIDKAYISGIAEYASPFRVAIDNHVFHHGFWFLLAAAIITLILNFRSMAFQHIALIIALAALALTAIRYIPFFVLAAPLVAIYFPDRKLVGIYRLLPLLVVLAWLGTMDFQNVLKFRAAKTFPREAVRFLNTAKPSGNIFNHVFWGGYLMCYTDYPVFADGRGLAENLTIIHNQLLGGNNWKGPLSYFQINTIIIPGQEQLSYKTYPLLFELQKDDGWALIYQDDEALIFMRNIPQNRDFLTHYAISKDRITTHIITRYYWLFKNEM